MPHSQSTYKGNICWTYIFDRAYLGFDFLSTLLEAGAHFVVRFKAVVGYRILDRFAVTPAPTTAGFRLTSDWTISLPGWEGVATGQLPVARWQVDPGLDRSLRSERAQYRAAV